ncbi:signal peptidase I [bacterium]|nr:signal peptidase I [bacterium]
MAPTLFGRHKDVVCPQCGVEYEVGASCEMTDDGNRLDWRLSRAQCPNCRFVTDAHELLAFKGDRILVNKFPYELGQPQRWDVCVFKYPEDPERNYIKRLVGLPGETIRIKRGDVYARPVDGQEFSILRKGDPEKQRAIQILVADDTHPPRQLLKAGWPERWAGMQPSGDAGSLDGWTDSSAGLTFDAENRTYTLDGKSAAWLRYRNFVPNDLDWRSVTEGLSTTPNPRPELITDFYAYNSFDAKGRPVPEPSFFWVGDLTVSGRMHIRSVDDPQATVKLELVEGVRRYWCEIELSTGKATLSHTNELNPDGEPIVLATGNTYMRPPGRFDFVFANVDDRLCLWINNRLIPFGADSAYKASALPDPQEADLLPVGFQSQGAVVEFSRLKLQRDIYYQAYAEANDDVGPFPDQMNRGEYNRSLERPLHDALSHPSDYARLYRENLGPIEFHELKGNEYFVMGDNSPQSLDSRLWPNTRQAINRHAVPRNAFVGKAFAIYWPHGIPFLNDGQGYGIVSHSRTNSHVENYPAYTIPFYPQFGRLLKRIR